MKNFELIEVLNVSYVFLWIKKNWTEICVNPFSSGFDPDLLKNKITLHNENQNEKKYHCLISID